MKPATVRLLVACGAAGYAVALVLTLSAMAPKIGTTRSAGWSTACDPGSCWVSFITPNGPAAGLLQPKDRVLAVNDVDGFNARRVVALTTRGFPPGTRYSMRIRRGAEEHTVALVIGARSDRTAIPRAAAPLAISLCYVVAALVAGWRRPDFPTARWVSVACYLTACNFLGLAEQSLAPFGWQVSRVGGALRFTSPWFLVAAYVVLEHFPRPVEQTVMWRRMRNAIVIVAATQWVASGVATLPTFVPADRARQVADYIPPIIGTVSDGLWAATLAAVFVAGLLTIRRNYRIHSQPDDRRRTSLFVAAILSSFAVVATIALLPYLGIAPNNTWITVGNLWTISVPIALLYGVRKHRLMGIRLVLRQSLHGLLAAQALRAIILLPLIWPFVRAALNPQLSAGQLFGPGVGTAVMMGGAGATMIFRRKILTRVDYRFFRDSYERDHVIEVVMEQVRTARSFEDISRLVTTEIAAAFRTDAPLLYWRTLRGHDFECVGRPRVLAASAVTRYLDARQALAQLLETLPEDPSLADVRDHLLIVLPGSANHAAGFLLLGEKASQEPYTSSEVSALRRLAAQLGLQNENRLLAEDRLTAVDDERKRMARELHDTLSQGFAGIFLHLESARELIGDDPDQSRVHVEHASDLAKRSLTEARASVRNLRSDAATFDLEQQLQGLAQRLNVHPDIQVELRTDYPVHVATDTARHLLRIVEESLTNALKHSGASRIDVHLESNPLEVRLTITDNGRGFDTAAIASRGFGLLGMKERSTQMSGSLEIVSAVGTGTTIRVAVPVMAC